MSACVVPCMVLCCILHRARVLCSFKDDTTIVILDPDMMLGMSPPFDEVRTAIAATEPRDSHRCHGTYSQPHAVRALFQPSHGRTVGLYFRAITVRL